MPLLCFVVLCRSCIFASPVFWFFALTTNCTCTFPSTKHLFFWVWSKKERESAHKKLHTTIEMHFSFNTSVLVAIERANEQATQCECVCVCVRLVCFILCANAQAEQNVCLSTLFGSIFWLAFSCNLTVCCWSFALVHLIAHNVFHVYFCERMFWFPF